MYWFCISIYCGKIQKLNQIKSNQKPLSCQRRSPLWEKKQLQWRRGWLKICLLSSLPPAITATFLSEICKGKVLKWQTDRMCQTLLQPLFCPSHAINIYVTPLHLNKKQSCKNKHILFPHGSQWFLSKYMPAMQWMRIHYSNEWLSHYSCNWMGLTVIIIIWSFVMDTRRLSSN